MWQPETYNAPISIDTNSDIIPFVSRSLKACWYISLLSFLDLALRMQSGENETSGARYL